MKKILFSLFLIALIIVFACEKKEEIDTEAPVIELKGSNPLYVNLDSAYIEPGYTATDNKDGDITSEVEVSGTVNVHTEGDYLLHYNVADKAGNKAEEKTRKVKVLRF